MLAWATFAYILDGVVTNIGAFEPNEYDKANMIAKATHGDRAFALDVTYIPVQIGDKYDSQGFYRIVDEQRVNIEPYSTENNRISVLESQSTATAESINNLELALVELYESGVSE